MYSYNGVKIGDIFRNSGADWVVVNINEGYTYPFYAVRISRTDGGDYLASTFILKSSEVIGNIDSLLKQDTGWLDGNEIAVPKTKTTIQEDLKRIKNNE